MTWLSCMLTLIAAVVQPQSAHCPHGWWLCLGVRGSGDYACCMSAGDDRELHAPVIEIESRVYCVEGDPVAIDGITVACRRGGWT